MTNSILSPNARLLKRLRRQSQWQSITLYLLLYCFVFSFASAAGEGRRTSGLPNGAGVITGLANLSHSQEALQSPLTTSTGDPRPLSFGVATFSLNSAHTALSFTATIYNIDVTGTQTPDPYDNLRAAHIHVGAAPGSNGPVRWGFFGMPLNDNNPQNTTLTPFATGVGGIFSGTWDLPEGNANTNLTDNLPGILAGLAYINFHTVQFGGGEIRGQIIMSDESPTSRLWYLDMDGDGYGNPAMSVRATSKPAGFVDNRLDCNDSDPTVHSPFTYYRDADGDGYGDVAGRITACSSTPPAGYVSNFRDCNDADPTAYREFTFFHDMDGDGVGDAGSSITICHSETPPLGYVRTKGDCDDKNPALQYPRTYYRDADGDGYGDKNGRTLICSLVPPRGYVTNYSDCDDTKVLYKDADGDGAGSNTKVACGGVENNTDCDDGNPGVQTCVTTCTTPSFAPAVTFPSGGNGPRGVVTGDFNGDGKTDIVVTNNSANNVALLLGNGSGSFGPATSFTTGGNGPESVVAGDFNGDGKLDLAVANHGSGTIGILRGDGIGGFFAPTLYASGGLVPLSLTTGDFNGDGKTDLATVNQLSDNIAVLINNGIGLFFGAVTYTTGGDNPVAIRSNDFNGDGKADLVVVNNNPSNAALNRVAVLIGTGTGTFGPAINYPIGGTNSYNITTADFNGDGKADVAVTNSTEMNVSVLFGNGSGGFLPAANYPAGGNFTFRITSGDFNGDGKPDLAIINAAPTNITILLNNGAGAFAPPVAFNSGGTPANIATGDFNSDGRTDIVAANGTEHTVGVLLNNCEASVGTLVNKAPNANAAQNDLLNKVSAFALLASPNPVRHTTRIQYSVPMDAQVSLKIYDMLGREVNALFSGQRSAGIYSQEYNTQKLSSGVYYCRMVATANGKQYLQTQKLVKTE